MIPSLWPDPRIIRFLGRQSYYVPYNYIYINNKRDIRDERGSEEIKVYSGTKTLSDWFYLSRFSDSKYIKPRTRGLPVENHTSSQTLHCSTTLTRDEGDFVVARSMSCAYTHTLSGKRCQCTFSLTVGLRSHSSSCVLSPFSLKTLLRHKPRSTRNMEWKRYHPSQTTLDVLRVVLP